MVLTDGRRKSLAVSEIFHLDSQCVKEKGLPCYVRAYFVSDVSIASWSAWIHLIKAPNQMLIFLKLGMHCS